MKLIVNSKTLKKAIDLSLKVIPSKVAIDELKSILISIDETKPAMVCPGFFMLFQKAYWKENNFQQPIENDHGLLFDLAFSRPAKENFGIKIIKGAYIWHSYRIMQSNFANKDHLK